MANPCFRLIPFLTADFIQLRHLCSFAGRILLQRIELGGQHIEVRSARILDFHVITRYAVHLNFFDTAVNTKTVALVHDIVTDRKIRKILDFLTGILRFLPVFLLLFSKNIRLCNQHKFLHRIFKASAGRAVDQHDLARFQNTLRILAVEGRNLLILQVLCQMLRPRPRRTRQYNTVTRFFPGFQIFYQKRELIVIRIDRFHRHTEFVTDIPLALLRLHQRYGNTAAAVQFCHKLRRTAHQLRLSRQEVSLFETVAHALLKFCFQRIGTLDDAVRLIEENAAVLRQILKKRDGLRIKIMKILLRSLQNFALADLIADFLCRMADTRRFLRHHLVAELCALRFCLFFNRFHTARNRILC